MRIVTEHARIQSRGNLSCIRSLRRCATDSLGSTVPSALSCTQNNYVEFQGLLDLLKWAETTKISKLEIFCDSALVVNTVNGVWELKSEDLRPLWLLATALRVRGQHTLKHVDDTQATRATRATNWPTGFATTS